MTTVSSTFFQEHHGACSSSIEADYLSLSVDSLHDLAELVSKGLQLNGRQCQDLSSKLAQTVENIQKLIPPYGPLKVPYMPALKNLYTVLEKAKLLVHQCCDPDWCRAAVFQILNEWAFRELLLEVGLCYNVIYELTRCIIRDWVWTLIQVEDLRQSSLFLPTLEDEVLQDEETLKRRLQHVAAMLDDCDSYLARYLLGKLECISASRMSEDFIMPDTFVWMNETEPQGTWRLQRVLGSGSGAACVCCYEWLGISCARKEFHCKVEDVIFRKEAAILAQLNHPNIAKFFCCGNDPKTGKYFIAMELMEMSLDSLIESRAKAGRSLPILLVLDIMTQIARGVWYLHGLKIAHRDLKPLNVVVTESRAAHLEDYFCVKLVDFGMSKTKVQASKSSTISIPGVGTTKYRAPEVFPQAQGVAQDLKRKVNWFKADAYSFGITCAVLLLLKNPFDNVLPSQLYEDLLQGVRPELPGECPEALVSLLKDCWATNPQSRPGFAEICSRLEKCKLQELLRVSSEDLQGGVGYEYVDKTVSMEHYDEQPVRATSVPYEQSQCATFDADDAEEGVGISQYHQGNPSIVEYSEDRPSIMLSELEPKKVGLWSQTISNLAQVMSMDGLVFKNSRFQECARHTLQQKCQEFDVKPTLIPYEELRAATRDFHKDMKLACSPSGLEYKGVLQNGNVVVLKKYHRSHFYHQSTFDGLSNEVVISTKMKHKNILTLKGCCLHAQHWLVVYEYVENLNVYKILLEQGPHRQMVPWSMRFKICLGVTEGLHYLHELAHPRIIHQDITPMNVFLNKNFDPKIGNFSNAILFLDKQNHISMTGVVQTKGHVSPKYRSFGEPSDKFDIYAFGILCLQIISGRHYYLETMPQDQKDLLEWAWQLHEQDKLLDLVDPTLHLTDVEVQDVQQMIKLCLMCIQNKRETQPSMACILSILQGEMEWDGQVRRYYEVCDESKKA